MPTQLAHEAVNLALQYTEKGVEWGKSGGLSKAVITRLEGPVNKALSTRAAQTVLKIGDSVLTSADGHLDAAIESRHYKAATAFAHSTVARTTAATASIQTTATRVTTPVVNVYTSALAFADRQVESYLPDAEASDRHAPLSLTGVTAKATRRAVKKVGAVKTGVVMRVDKSAKAARAAVRAAFEAAKPANLKKNTKAAYKASFAACDGVIDKYLPGAKDDALVAVGPITLATKLSKRGTKHTIAGVKALATAVKNSPTTFKKAVRGAVAAVKRGIERAQNMGLTIRYKAYDTLTPYIEAVMSRSLALVKATDQMLLKRKLTAGVRNFAVDKYQVILAPYVEKYLPKPVAVPANAAKISLAVEAKKPVPVESPMSVESESSDVIEAAAEAGGDAEAGGKKKKAKRVRKRTETPPASPLKQTEGEEPADEADEANDDASC